MFFFWAIMYPSQAAMHFGRPSLSVCRSLLTTLSGVM